MQVYRAIALLLQENISFGTQMIFILTLLGVVQKGSDGGEVAEGAENGADPGRRRRALRKDDRLIVTDLADVGHVNSCESHIYAISDPNRGIVICYCA